MIYSHFAADLQAPTSGKKYFILEPSGYRCIFGSNTFRGSTSFSVCLHNPSSVLRLRVFMSFAQLHVLDNASNNNPNKFLEVLHGECWMTRLSLRRALVLIHTDWENPFEMCFFLPKYVRYKSKGTNTRTKSGFLTVITSVNGKIVNEKSLKKRVEWKKNCCASSGPSTVA